MAADLSLPKTAEFSRFVVYSPTRGVFIRYASGTQAEFSNDQGVVLTSATKFPTFQAHEVPKLDCPDARARECNPRPGSILATVTDLANHGIPVNGGV